MSKSTRLGTIAVVTALVSALGSSAVSAQDKYSVKVPGGLAFAEFKGYEGWHLVSISPPQGNDAKCGFGCHTIVQKRDYVFTDYGNR